MADMDEIRDELASRWEAGNALNDGLLAALDSLDASTVREIARMLLDEVRYLYDHLPESREQVAPQTCSGETYHVPPCGNYGREGSCDPLPEKAWCHSAGFDCRTCEIVDRLLAILAEAGA